MNQLRSIDAIIFDLDGTLIPVHLPTDGTLVRFFARIPGVTNPVDFVRRLWVATEIPLNHTMRIVDRMGLEPRLRSWLDAGRRWKGIATFETLTSVEGADAAVSELARHYALGVVTNRARREAHQFLESSGLVSFMGVVATREDVRRLKPHPEAIRQTAARLGAPPERTLVVGDMPVDMRAARRAGAQAVGVMTGFSTEGELRRAGADLVLRSVCDLPRILPRIRRC